ncbi:MAG: hypothetical protein ABW178_05780 [Pseudoxanthomonas sp.]
MVFLAQRTQIVDEPGRQVILRGVGLAAGAWMHWNSSRHHECAYATAAADAVATRAAPDTHCLSVLKCVAAGPRGARIVSRR